MTNQPRSLKKIWDQRWPKNPTCAHFRCFMKQVSLHSQPPAPMHNFGWGSVHSKSLETMKKNNSWISWFHEFLAGEKQTSCFQDMFGRIWNHQQILCKVLVNELPKWHPCSPYCVVSLEFCCHKNMNRGTNKHQYLSTSSATKLGGVELRNFDEPKTRKDSERATIWTKDLFGSSKGQFVSSFSGLLHAFVPTNDQKLRICHMIKHHSIIYIIYISQHDIP